MASLSMSVSEFRFYFDMAEQPDVSEIMALFPNKLLILYKDQSYAMNVINGFVSHSVLLPMHTIQSLRAFLRHVSYRRNHDMDSVEYQLLLKEMTITDQYIEFDHRSDIRFPVDVEMGLLEQHSEQNDRVYRLMESVFHPQSPYLKLTHENWMQVYQVMSGGRRRGFSRYTQPSVQFMVNNRRLYLGMVNELTPAELTAPFVTNQLEHTFEMNRKDMQKVYDGFKKKVIDEIILIPFSHFCIVEGYKGGTLKWKWHCKFVEKARKTVSVIRKVAEDSAII